MQVEKLNGPWLRIQSQAQLSLQGWDPSPQYRGRGERGNKGDQARRQQSGSWTSVPFELRWERLTGDTLSSVPGSFVRRAVKRCGHIGTLSHLPLAEVSRVPVVFEASPLQVFLSGCNMKPTGQLQWTPVAASWHLLSQPPLLTAQVSVEGGVGGDRVTSLAELRRQRPGARPQPPHGAQQEH